MVDRRLAGLAVRGGLRERIQGMRPIDAVNLLLDLIETSVPEHSPHSAAVLLDFGFQRQQAMILTVLREARGRLVTYDALCIRCALGEPTTVGNLHAQMVTIRRRLRLLNWPVQIVSVPGLGLRMLVDHAWRWPDMEACP